MAHPAVVPVDTVAVVVGRAAGVDRLRGRWGFMTLIANHRAVRHGDRDALLLAQRWSTYLAVTFAVGAER